MSSKQKKGSEKKGSKKAPAKNYAKPEEPVAAVVTPESTNTEEPMPTSAKKKGSKKKKSSKKGSSSTAVATEAVAQTADEPAAKATSKKKKSKKSSTSETETVAAATDSTATTDAPSAASEEETSKPKKKKNSKKNNQQQEQATGKTTAPAEEYNPGDLTSLFNPGADAEVATEARTYNATTTQGEEEEEEEGERGEGEPQEADKKDDDDGEVMSDDDDDDDDDEGEGGEEASAKEKQEAETIVANKSRQICNLFQKGACTYGPTCRFAHLTPEEAEQEEKDRKRKIKDQSHATDPRLSRTIFASNVPCTCDKRMVKKVFSVYGKVDTVRVRSVARNNPKLPRKGAVITKDFHAERKSFNAYIVFEADEEAEKALAFNGQVLDKHHIWVDKASDEEKKLDRTLTVFLGNLPFNCEEESIYDFFQHCGEITKIRLVRDAEFNIGKGFGFLRFSTPEGQKAALAFDGSEVVGRKIRVTRLVRKVKEKKQAVTPVRADKGAKRRLQTKAKHERNKKVKKEGGAAKPTGFQGEFASEKVTVKQPKNLRKKIRRKQRSSQKSNDPAAAASAGNKRKPSSKKQGDKNKKRKTA